MKKGGGGARGGVRAGEEGRGGGRSGRNSETLSLFHCQQSELTSTKPELKCLIITDQTKRSRSKGTKLRVGESGWDKGGTARVLFLIRVFGSQTVLSFY